MPNALARVMFVSLSLLVCGTWARCAAQTTTAAKEAPATVSGRVTNGEKGMQGIEVMLTPPDPTSRIKAAARATSDAEGRFRMTGVPPGRYQLMAVAPAYVVSDMTGWPPGRTVNLSPGDAVEDLNFTLTRGGVITGRVTDSEGKPVIAEQVHIASADESKGQQVIFMGGPGRMTDDRGIYRIYGLAAGRYRVSVGQDRNSGMIRMGGPRRFYRLTFHPDATEREKAKVVEVTEGGETEDVDISVAKASRTFKVEGRFVSAETGRPSRPASATAPSTRRPSASGALASPARGRTRAASFRSNNWPPVATPSSASAAIRRWTGTATPRPSRLTTQMLPASK